MEGITTMNDDQKWKIESDVRTLKESEMIKADPARMKSAMDMMDEEMKAMMKIAGKSIEDHAKTRFPKTYPKSGE